MKLATLSILCLSLSARAQDVPPADPEGTVRVEVEVGQSVDALARASARVVCDDPEVVGPELAEDGGTSFVLRGLKPGETLCGVRQAGEVPGGLYRVKVVPKKPKGQKKGAPKKKGPRESTKDEQL